MALAFDATAQATISAQSSLTFSHTCTGSNLILLVGVYTNDTNGDVVTGITYNGVAMTRIGVKLDGTINTGVYLYYLINPATGAHNVIVSTSSGGTTIEAWSASYTGASQTTQPDASITNQVSIQNLSQALTTVADNSWLAIMARYSGVAATLTAGTGTTERGTNQTQQGFYGDSNSAQTPAGSHSLAINADAGGGRYILVMASIAPVATAVTAVNTASTLSMMGIG